MFQFIFLLQKIEVEICDKINSRLEKEIFSTNYNE